MHKLTYSNESHELFMNFPIWAQNIFIKFNKIKRYQFEFHFDQIHLQMRQFLIQFRQIDFIQDKSSFNYDNLEFTNDKWKFI